MTNNKTQILYLSANPRLDVYKDDPDLADDLEITYEATWISKGLEASRYGQDFVFDSFYNVQFEDLESYIGRYNPDILHLAFHHVQGQLLFMNKANVSEKISVDRLVEVLKKAASQVKLIVLRIYSSETLAKKIFAETEVKAVIYVGSKKEMAECHEFMGSFYQLLGNGIDLKKAYNLAHNTFDVAKCGIRTRLEKEMLVFAPSQKEKANENDGNAEHLCASLILASTPANRRRLNYMFRELDYVAGQYKEGECMIISPTSKRDILMAIAYYRPRMMLFTSHGTMDFISFYDEKQKRIYLDKDWLYNLFEAFRDTIECVLFSSCENMAVAYAVSKHIRYVIGTNRPVFDDLASIVSKVFYKYFLNMRGEMTYEEAFASTLETLRESESLGNNLKANLQAYEFFRREDYQKHRSRRQREIVSITKDIAKKGYLVRGESSLRSDNEWIIRQLEQNYEKWIWQFKNESARELISSFLRNSIYRDFKDIVEFYIDQYLDMIQKTDYDRIAFLPLNEEESGRDVSDWMLCKYLNSIQPKRCWLNLKQPEKDIREIFHIVLITNVLGSFDDFKQYAVKNKVILKKKRVTILTRCSVDSVKKEILRFADEMGMDIRIIARDNIGKAFGLYPAYKSKRRLFESTCKKIGMAKEEIFGQNEAEALCFYYDGIPAETLGLFSYQNEGYQPLYHYVCTDNDDTMAASTISEKLTKEEYKEQIKKYFSENSSSFTFWDLSQRTGLSFSELRAILDEMVVTESKSKYGKTEMYEALFLLIIKHKNYPQTTGDYDLL